ncbi:MAG: PTS sugar transporter subunit IIB [Mycoplasmatales bacterium]
MNKIIAVCGSGLGSSFMIELNIKDVLSANGISEIEVTHTSVTDCPREENTLYVCGLDLASTVETFGKTIILNNIMDKVELEQKLLEVIKETNE